MPSRPSPGLLVCAALSALAAAAPPAYREVQRSYAAFEQALAERDAEAALALLSEASLAEWERDRRIALHGSREEVEALAPGPRMLVLALRQQAPVFLLRDGTPRELAAHAVRSGLADREALAVVELRDVAVLDPVRASGLVYASGLPSSLRAGFVREAGAWKLDLPASLASLGRLIGQTAQVTGSSENAVIVELVAAASGEPVGKRVWQPLLR